MHGNFTAIYTLRYITDTRYKYQNKQINKTRKKRNNLLKKNPKKNIASSLARILFKHLMTIMIPSNC